MAKVRVHELAKELNIQSKDIINYLSGKNITVVAANSIEEDTITMVRKQFDKKGEQMNKNEEKEASNEAVKNESVKQEDKPKKKSSITAVYNPQNSKMGVKRPEGQKGGRNSRNNSNQQHSGNQNRTGQNNRQGYDRERPAYDRQSQNTQNTQNNTSRPSYDRNNSNQNQTSGDRPYNNNRPQNNNNYNNNRPQNNNNYNNNRSQNNNNYNNNRPQNNNNYNNNNNNNYNNNNNNSYNNNRPASDRNNNQRTGGDRPFRSQNDRGARNPNEKSGNRPYQNNRPFQNRNQGDKNNQRGPANRGKEQKSRFEQEISKLNQNQPVAAEEPKTRETRDNRRGTINQKQNQNQNRNFTPGKKQERFTNLEKQSRKKKPNSAPAPVKEEETIKNIVIPEKLTLKELADKLKVQASAIVKKLFLQGTMVTVNQEIDFALAEEIALEYNCICEQEVKIDVIEELLKEEEEDESKMVKRPPVVCVMGHVDHGKTSLLDAIRDTHVIDREAGGITQHIGAYMVTCNGEKITFLDTPGHEAFTAMRMRGANSTDIAILVVAADDGVMPQTVEAISHAKAAGVEIIVAINKMDKPSANIERVKQELSEHELIPEDWGGSTVFVPVSAHTNEGIEQLLEMILLTAEIGELKANPDRQARGLVIEAQLDKGRGAVATVLVQKGTLKVGQPIAAGSCHGKVRAMIDDKGRRVQQAGPSTPVEILGLNNVPNAGEIFVCTDSEKEAKSFADTFISQGREKLLDDTKAKMSLDDLFTQIKSGNLKELGIIVKADVQGSVEAVKQSLLKLSNEEVIVKIIHGGVGAINESDVSLASTSNAIIIGFNVRPDATAKATADREGVDLRLYKVIYNAIEDVQAAMKGLLDPIYEEKVLGHAEVRQIFKASGIGNIAGSYVLDGIFQRGCKVRISREGEQIFEGNLASLKRFKDDVKEVKTGYECGLVFEGYNEIQELDVVEAYTMVEVPR